MRVMSKKGFVHLIPLFAIAVVLVGALAAVSVNKENSQKQAVGKVLSERSGDEDRSGSNSSESGRESNDDSGDRPDEVQGSEDTKSDSGSNQSETRADSVQPKVEVKKVEAEIEKEANKSKLKVENASGKFESETESGKTKTKLEANGLKIEVEGENGKLVIKVKDENGQEVEVEESEKQDLVEAANEELEDDGIRLATRSADLGFIQDGRKVRTNFPLSVDPASGQLFVTTPAGIKIVTILPSVAIENMIKAGILTRVDEPVVAPSPPPAEGSGSAGATQGAQISVLGSSIELTEQNNQPVYRISGVKDEKLFGLLPVGVKLITVVSASDGSLVDIQQGIFARILDLLSN
ncbi:MAG: hypothetical protein UT84_C0003G0040 [Candidatus Curtissbacteria bacterium GW2011_GWA1_40_16]|uniref:Uncharacterized protein n=1 Tax=Candidatus Curtissbacteria bacterium GW2011_GWA1_40_16 TaxID=1618405 RepID=A0A0G0TVD5_9BACT|nr:MAG: hypothetical protein UT84_C0003G0040 [Candidatus Curtissbacteria bacterium GW2011_GWA1_40_16]